MKAETQSLYSPSWPASSMPGELLSVLAQKISNYTAYLHRPKPLAKNIIARQSPDTYSQPFNEGSDWEAIQAVCGYNQQDFEDSSTLPPLSAAAIQHFCRNHRECDITLGGQFEVLDHTMPEPLGALYSVYISQSRLDAEATFFLAQASGTVRVAGVMADLLAIGGFSHSARAVYHESRAFSISAAFDTAPIIDAANKEAWRRLALPPEDRDHLLRQTPEDIGLLAMNIAAQARLSPHEFLEKANRLAEARLDVNRFPNDQRFVVALNEGDLPLDRPWAQRLITAMNRLLPALSAPKDSLVDNEPAFVEQYAA